MDNNNKSKIFGQESPKKNSDKRMILQNQINIDKRKSDELNFINSTNKSRNSQNNKLNKIPFNIRSSYQEKRLIPNINIENNVNKDNKDKEAPAKKDKNYYLNLLNNIYLNDSHFSNKNTVKNNNNNNSINNSINNNSLNKNSNNSKNINTKKEMNNIDVNKKFMKRKTCNLSKGRCSKDSLGKNFRSSKKVINYVDNEIRDNSKKLSINDNKDNIDIKFAKKLSNFSKEMISSKKEPKILSEKAVSTFKNPESSIKFKMKEIYKFKSSQNIQIISEAKIDETLKEEKNENNETMQKEVRSIKINNNNNESNIRNSKRSRNIINENENGNLVRCSTKINSSKNMASDKSIKIKNPKKLYKTCFFCCLIKNDESFSDN